MSFKHEPLEKFQILTEPSEAAVINLLLVESKLPAVILLPSPWANF
jgi:hypothetical protein